MTHVGSCVITWPLVCWRMQVRMGGVVHLDNAFEDVQFPARKCATVVEVARNRIGTHHTSPRKLHALWRAYTRTATREGWEWNGTAAILAAEAAETVGASSTVAAEDGFASAVAAGAADSDTTSVSSTPAILASSVAAGRSSIPDPSRPQRCSLSAKGDPYEELGDAGANDDAQSQSADWLPRPVPAGTCVAAREDDVAMRTRYPHCLAHMAHVVKHASTMACHGALGRKRCDGFQLDVSDACNVQYFLFCEQVPGCSLSWRGRGVPLPDGSMPPHACSGVI